MLLTHASDTCFRLAGVIYQRTEQGRAKHAARQRAYWARQRVKQLGALSVRGLSSNARLRRHMLDSRIASPQAWYISPRNREIPSAAEKWGAWGELKFCG